MASTDGAHDMLGETITGCWVSCAVELGIRFLLTVLRLRSYIECLETQMAEMRVLLNKVRSNMPITVFISATRSYHALSTVKSARTLI